MSELPHDRSAEGHEQWTPETADQVTDLVFRYLDGVLDADEVGKLNAMLLRHDQARDLLASLTVERFVLSEVLQARKNSQENHDLLNELAQLEADAETAGPIDITEQLQAMVVRPQAPPPPSDEQQGPRVIIIPRVVPWIGIAAILLIGVLLVWPWISRQGVTERWASPPVVAQITKTQPPSFEPEADLAVGREILAGEQVLVESGFVELDNGHGVRLVVQGPSVLRFDEALRLSLDEGRLAARVEEAGKGFTVQTPSGRIVDHGTEFGVTYEPGKQTLETSVFEGSVAIQSSRSEALPRTLTRGWNGRVDADGGVSIAPQQSVGDAGQSYVRKLSETGYTQDIFRLMPSAFWTFDEVRDDAVINHFNPSVFRGQHRGGSAVTLTKRVDAVSGFDQALKLDGKSYMDFGDVLEFESDEAFTFAFWLRPAADEPFGSILSRMSVADDFRGYDIYLDGQRLLFQLKHKFVGDPFPDQNDALRVDIQGIQAERWAHVAFVYDGSGTAAGVAAYLNGQPVPTGVLSDSLTGTIQADAPFRIGRRLEDNDSIFLSRGSVNVLAEGSHFTGSIDDLAVFPQALPADHVLGLYQSSIKPSAILKGGSAP